MSLINSLLQKPSSMFRVCRKPVVGLLFPLGLQVEHTAKPPTTLSTLRIICMIHAQNLFYLLRLSQQCVCGFRGRGQGSVFGALS